MGMSESSVPALTVVVKHPSKFYGKELLSLLQLPPILSYGIEVR